MLDTTYWVLVSLAFATPAIGLGSFFLGAAVVIISFIAIVAGYIHVMRRRSLAAIDRVCLGALAGSLLLLGGWYVLFHRHTIIHAGYMIRPLVMLPIVAGMIWLCGSRAAEKSRYLAADSISA